MQTYTFIYGLKDPRDGMIHYVGKANHPTARYRKHLEDTSSNLDKVLWIAELVSQKLKPELVILEKVSKADWPAKEREWIAKGRAEGWPLTNISEGGSGGSDFPFTFCWADTMRFYLSPADLEEFIHLDQGAQDIIGSATTLAMYRDSKYAITRRGDDLNGFDPLRQARRGREVAQELLLSLGAPGFDQLISEINAEYFVSRS